MPSKDPKTYWNYVNRLHKAKKQKKKKKKKQSNVKDFDEFFLKISTPRLIRMMSLQLPNFLILSYKMILILKSQKKTLWHQ